MTDYAPEDVEYVPTFVSKTADIPAPNGAWLFNVKLPSWLAVWDGFAAWEFPRFRSMFDHLGREDVLIDIGSEFGWQSVCYAEIVGPENMVLVEPSPTFWPNIKGTWEANFGVPPRACYQGLMSNASTSQHMLGLAEFPAVANGPLTDVTSYQYIHEHGHVATQITLDDYVRVTGIVPTALTMDVEGAELQVLFGAERTLRDHDLKVWVSIHPDLSLKDYSATDEDLHNYMAGLGYVGEHLSTDHEEHWYFRKGTP